LHNKSQGWGASVASAAGPFTKRSHLLAQRYREYACLKFPETNMYFVRNNWFEAWPRCPYQQSARTQRAAVCRFGVSTQINRTLRCNINYLECILRLNLIPRHTGD
jgi:hypothetical protein